MRRKKKNSPAMPFAAGFLAGGAVILITSALAAAVFSIVGGSSSGAALAALLALAAGSFAGGRVTGTLRRRDGLKCGAICGLTLLTPLVVLSLMFGLFGWVMLLVKAAVCVAFAAAGGVFGVNSGTI
ncbi:MAG: TIGR04086 family membrane protein [Oscillospiraceae bacterium]|nr:TIGR04086 family membrane protein [Oscillospiraceae bacterium]